MNSGKARSEWIGPSGAPARAAASARSLEIAVALHQQGRLQAAATLYERVLRADHNQIDALNNLAWLRLQQGRPGEAARLARRALYRQPNSAESCNTLGLALHAQGQSEEAVAFFRRAV